MLSICITVKNRSKVPTSFGTLNLLPNCIKSINKSFTLDSKLELIIADWNSTDWPIKEWIEDYTSIPTHIININKKDNKFSVGKGRNIAANYATNDIILFLDADMLINAKAVADALSVVEKNNVCFPPIMYQLTQGTDHWKLHEGGGNVIITKELFYKAGKWPEYWSYGFEDTDFVNNLKKITNIHTSTEPFFHQWHPEQIGWKEVVKEEDKTETMKRMEFYKKQQENDLNIIKNMVKFTLNDPNTTHFRKNT